MLYLLLLFLLRTKEKKQKQILDLLRFLRSLLPFLLPFFPLILSHTHSYGACIKQVNVLKRDCTLKYAHLFLFLILDNYSSPLVTKGLCKFSQHPAIVAGTQHFLFLSLSPTHTHTIQQRGMKTAADQRVYSRFIGMCERFSVL